MPGFSEAKGDSLTDPIPKYYYADRTATALRNVKKADVTQLNDMLLYHKMITTFISRKNNFSFLSGLPLEGIKFNMAVIHFAYAALKLKNYKLFNSYMDAAAFNADNDADKDYLKAVKQWVAFEVNGLSKEKALTIIKKFYFADTVKRLQENLKKESLLDEFLMECGDCGKCKFRELCCYDSIRELTACAGKQYSAFVDGQSRENFKY